MIEMLLRLVIMHNGYGSVLIKFLLRLQTLVPAISPALMRSTSSIHVSYMLLFFGAFRWLLGTGAPIDRPSNAKEHY